MCLPQLCMVKEIKTKEFLSLRKGLIVSMPFMIMPTMWSLIHIHVQ